MTKQIFSIPVLIISVWLSSCSHIPLAEDVARSWKLAREGSPDFNITRAKVDELPYASMGVTVGKGGKSLVILSRIDQDTLHWQSADRSTLVTRNGRLLKTVGLQCELVRTHFNDDDPIASAPHWIRTGQSVTWFVDVMPGSHYQIPVTAEYEVVGHEKVTILERTFNAIHIREHIKVDPWDWKAANDYWVNPRNGFTYKSVQHYCPDHGPVVMEVYKAAAKE